MLFICKIVSTLKQAILTLTSIVTALYVVLVKFMQIFPREARNKSVNPLLTFRSTCAGTFFKQIKILIHWLNLGAVWSLQVFLGGDNAAAVQNKQATSETAELLQPQQLEDVEQPMTASRDQVTSQPLVADVIPQPSHIAARQQDDVTVEHVTTVSRDQQLETTPPVPVSEAEDIAEDSEIFGKSEIARSDDVIESAIAATNDVIAPQQFIATDMETQQIAQQQQQQEQQSVCTEAPATTPSSSSSAAPSTAVTATVARQQNTQQPASSTTTTVDSTDQARGKRRHKDDKSKTSEQSAEVLITHLSLYNVC